MQSEHPVNILLVDDRPENLLALEALLRPLGHTIVKAFSGTEALKSLLQHDFAVILLDVQMPGMDGFETAELIRGRERSQGTPIIFLTAVNTSEGHVFHGYSLGAVDYLLKPIVPEILLSKVNVFVDLWVKTEKIRRQAEELEQRVQERTATLAEANAALRKEIATRQRAEGELAQALVREQRARAEAEAAVKLRDQFLSIASHELKTPLTTLFGYAQLIQRRFERAGEVEQQNKRLIDVVVEQSSRLNRLIETLLNISRIQTGQLQISAQPMDLAKLMRHVAGQVQSMLDQHTLLLEGCDSELMIDGDELRIEQVLHNLIQNAIKYSPAGGQIAVRLEDDEATCTISVVDRGIGIPAHALDRLFDRFYRADNADARNISGMGVGLFVVREIVEMHGGRIEVESQLDRGSTFRVRLPKVWRGEPAAAQAAAEA
ncbi:response regulator [Chloroflexia bacterium SDU3-3]|nr:response regulator [Chloroflexia bacterium SDU3-3]